MIISRNFRIALADITIQFAFQEADLTIYHSLNTITFKLHSRYPISMYHIEGFVIYTLPVPCLKLYITTPHELYFQGFCFMRQFIDCFQEGVCQTPHLI